MHNSVLFIVHDLYQDDVEFPLGIGYMAAVLQKHGYNVKIANQDIFHWSDEELAERFLKNDSYNIIGLGFLSARFTETVQPLCKIINKYKKDALLVLGGHGATSAIEYMLKTTKADIIVTGEGEDTIIDLMKNLNSLKDVKGIAYRIDDVHINERRKLIRDLDSIPFPAWDLFPMDIYTTNNIYMGQDKKEKSFPIITSRGCTSRCQFCYRMEKGIRFRSITSVMEELKILYNKYSITYFIFQDELFIANLKRLKEFIQGLKDHNLYGKIKYNVGGIRANIVTDEMVILLKESGCTYANIGFESVNAQCLKELQKNVTPEENIRCAEIMKKHNLTMGLNFIWGVPSDNEETIQSSVDFLKKYNSYKELRTIRPITCYPGCPLYYDAISKGLLLGPGDFFEKFKNSDLISTNFTKVPIKECYKLLYAANSELIDDHVQHSDMSRYEGINMKKSFYQLYFKGETKFRGARHFDRKEKEVIS